MGATQMTFTNSDPTLKEYFVQENDLPPEVWERINREGSNLDLPLSQYFGQGSELPPEVWVWLNREGAFSHTRLAQFVAPFPPPQLMENVSGLVSNREFASHGGDFWLALSKLVPRPLTQFSSVLDFGCGCGRLGRMFQGHPGKLFGCDIDSRHIEWMSQNIPYYTAQVTKPDSILPYGDGKFDLIISISILTHLSESSQDLLLGELFRTAHANALLLLTIHGERAMERAISEPKIWDMISVDKQRFDEAKARFDSGEYAFVSQWDQYPWCDPNSEHFPYGISFIPRSYIFSHWGRWFHIENYATGALHDWQDVIVMRPKKAHS